MSTLKANGVQTLGGKPILNSTGSIIQVVYTKLETSQIITSSSYTEITGLRTFITPTSSASRYWGLATLRHNNSYASSIQCVSKVTLDDVDISYGIHSGNDLYGHFQTIIQFSGTFSSSSVKTFKVLGYQVNGNSTQISLNTSNITIMEIVA